jgi:Ca-activated chloride channel homolog
MDFTNPHFADPHWLWLAVAGPLLLAWLQHRSAQARGRQMAAIASPHALAELTQSHSPARRRIKETLLLLALACVGLALARPQWGEFETANEWLGEDVLFALDCSKSMLATDVRPSRLQRAKLAILDYVRQNGHGRVGLVAFAGGAFLQCPLTFDREAFDDALEAVDERTIPVPGTDIGRALKEANLAMEKKSRRKLVVLVTDGEDLEKGGVQTAQSLATNGVVVFTIGVGSPAGTDIQVRNPAGQMTLLRDAKGEVVRSRLDEATLRAIAEETGGNYFPLGPRGDGLARIKPVIAQLDGVTRENRARRRGVERFHYPVALALLLITMERLIGTRRRKRNAVPVVALPLVASISLVVFGCVCLSPVARGATNALADTNNVVAAAPDPPPETAREFYNVGTRKLAEGKLADAESLFQSALATQDERVRPAALYNLGEVRFAQGVEALNKESSGKSATGRARSALARGTEAIQLGQSALAEKELRQMVSAYLSGRGARKELRGAMKAVLRAMEAHATALLKWRRALGDFRSAAELNPADTNAVQNAKTVERAIAELVDSLREMQQMGQMMKNQSQMLGEVLKQLKGQIPMEDMPPGAPGEDGEEVLPESLRGQEEAKGEEGQEMEVPLSPEEAGRLLDGYRLDGGRRLPMSGRGMGTDKEGKNDPHPTRPW